MASVDHSLGLQGVFLAHLFRQACNTAPTRSSKPLSGRHWRGQRVKCSIINLTAEVRHSKSNESTPMFYIGSYTLESTYMNMGMPADSYRVPFQEELDGRLLRAIALSSSSSTPDWALARALNGSSSSDALTASFCKVNIDVLLTRKTYLAR
jgi:hypothetical protein